MGGTHMRLAKVIGNIWATRKEEALTGLKLLIVQPIEVDGTPSGSSIVVGDRVGAGIGETVLVVSGSSARKATDRDETPIDAVVVAIVDTVEWEKTVRPPAAGAANGEGAGE